MVRNKDKARHTTKAKKDDHYDQDLHKRYRQSPTTKTKTERERERQTDRQIQRQR